MTQKPDNTPATADAPGKKPEKPDKSKPSDRLTTMMLGENNGRSDE